MALNYRNLVLGLFFIFSLQLQSQQLILGFDQFAGSGKSNDLGIQFSYDQKISNKSIQIGVELRSIDWGNHLGIKLGLGFAYFSKNAFTVGGISSFHPGIALFHQKSLGSFGLSHIFYLQWQSKKRSFLAIDLGTRYNFCPAYRHYGISTQFEFPITLKWGLRLGKKGPDLKDS